MKKLATTICLTVALLFGGAGMASALPPCPSDQSKFFHNCFGTYTFANGDKYVGEFRNGKKNGQGTYYHANGNKYVGEYRNGIRHGQGTYTFANGNKYVGEFKEDKYNGQGTFTFANGRKKEGIWKDNKFQYARSAAQIRRELKNKERNRKKAEQRRQKRRDRYRDALNKCLFDNVEKVINAHAKRIVEAECRRKIRKYKYW